MAILRTAPEWRLPSFLGVGVQKGGTTTLHEILASHPDVFLPSCKEVHYFSLHYDKGMSWYAHHFQDAKPAQLIGEITPYYLFHPEAARRIFNDLGLVKIVILLRDPLERTLSHYWHARRLGFEQLPLAQALECEQERLSGSEQLLKCLSGRHQAHQEMSYGSRSLYRHQVERFWQLFGRSNVLVRASEKLFGDQKSVIDEICNFLDLDPAPLGLKDRVGRMSNSNPIKPQVSGMSSRLIERLRYDLNDSYMFAANELGWGAETPWRWDVSGSLG